LAGQLNITCLTELINADKVKHNEQIGAVEVQHKITNVPDSSIRILRELLAIAGAGDQDQEPASSSSVFVSTLPENSGLCSHQSFYFILLVLLKSCQMSLSISF